MILAPDAFFAMVKLPTNSKLGIPKQKLASFPQNYPLMMVGA